MFLLDCHSMKVKIPSELNFYFGMCDVKKRRGIYRVKFY